MTHFFTRLASAFLALLLLTSSYGAFAQVTVSGTWLSSSITLTQGSSPALIGGKDWYSGTGDVTGVDLDGDGVTESFPAVAITIEWSAPQWVITMDGSPRIAYTTASAQPPITLGWVSLDNDGAGGADVPSAGSTLLGFSGGCTTPTAYAVTGGGPSCSGGAGVAIGLANSQTGVNYQLKNGAATVGSAVAGTTGSAIAFGNQTVAATYTVEATTATGGCTATMTGNAVVSVVTLPTNVLATGGTTRAADAECNDGAWTHYIHTSSNEIVLSIKKNGNAIGSIGSGLTVTAYTNAGWSNTSAQAITAPYVSSANPWYVMKRYWNVTPASQPTSDVSVRSYYTSDDLAGLNAVINPDITHNQLRFYKINGGGNPDPSAGHSSIAKASTYDATGYWEYANGDPASSTAWLSGTIGSHYYAEMVIRSFSGGGGGGSVGGGGAFPVEWVGISARQVNDKVLVNWSTASELNSSYFTLQRAADGETFSDLGSITAMGSSTTAQQYELSDPMPLAGRNVYRVQETGIDGAVSHSATVEVSYAPMVSVGTTGNSLVIRGAAAGDRFFLYDTAGRLVRDVTLSGGEQSVSAPTAGVYCWRMQNSLAPSSGKVLLQD